MPKQLPLFNIALGRQQRDEGIKRVTKNASGWVERRRIDAIGICLAKGCCCADDLRPMVVETDDQPHHPNAWGAIFCKSIFRKIGETRSRVPHNHAGHQYVWALRDPNYWEAVKEKEKANGQTNTGNLRRTWNREDNIRSECT